MNRRTFLTAIGASMIAVSGCAEQNVKENSLMKLENVEEATVDTDSSTMLMTRFIDRNAGVVLYYNARSGGSSGSGLTAIPIEQTDLK